MVGEVEEEEEEEEGGGGGGGGVRRRRREAEREGETAIREERGKGRRVKG